LLSLLSAFQRFRYALDHYRCIIGCGIVLVPFLSMFPALARLLAGDKNGLTPSPSLHCLILIPDSGGHRNYLLFSYTKNVTDGISYQAFSDFPLNNNWLANNQLLAGFSCRNCH